MPQVPTQIPLPQAPPTLCSIAHSAMTLSPRVSPTAALSTFPTTVPQILGRAKVLPESPRALWKVVKAQGRRKWQRVGRLILPCMMGSQPSTVCRAQRVGIP